MSYNHTHHHQSQVEYLIQQQQLLQQQQRQLQQLILQQQQQQQSYIQQNLSDNYIDYNLDNFDHRPKITNMNVDTTTSFGNIFDSPGTSNTDSQALSTLGNTSRVVSQLSLQQQQPSSQQSSSTNPQQQQNTTNQLTNATTSFPEGNHSTSSLERLGIDTSNITNPALNSFFQLPFELQIQQFPLTNPPLFDLQQPYYQNFNNLHHDNNQLNNDQLQYGDNLQQQFNSQNQFNKGNLPQQQQQQQQIPQQQQQQLFNQQPHYYGNGQQPALRRRISISNGQIGQLVQFTQQQIQLLNPSYSPEAVLALTAVLIQNNHANSTTASATSQRSAHSVNSSQVTSPVGLLQQQQLQQLITQQNKTLENLKLTSPTQVIGSDPLESSESPLGQQHPSGLNTNANGVPKHQLLYNNEIIFNPNNGPIPGTSAWKKQKLLERNRIAASKCRQRKKQQQQRLEQDIDKYVRDNRNLSLKVKILEKKLMKFSKIMEVHFSKCHSGDNSFPLLKELINDTEEEFAKVKLEDDDSDLYDLNNINDDDELDNLDFLNRDDDDDDELTRI